MSNVATKINDRPYIVGVMERWARWCHGSISGGVSITGRLMQGIKSNICPGWLDDVTSGKGHDPYCHICHGTGRVPMEAEITSKTKICHICDGNKKFAGVDCWRCRGRGKVRIANLKVNPACIPSTKNVGGHTPSDAVSVLVDDLISQWREHDETLWMAKVSVAEYHYNGTQEMKAAKLRISRAFFVNNHTKALRGVEAMLLEKMPT